jgi:hypothetical protein
VWCSVDGNDVLVNTTRQRQKGHNLTADPRATVLALDSDDSSRWIEIRGGVDLAEDGALEHLLGVALRGRLRCHHRCRSRHHSRPPSPAHVADHRAPGSPS